MGGCSDDGEVQAVWLRRKVSERYQYKTFENLSDQDYELMLAPFLSVPSALFCTEELA